MIISTFLGLTLLIVPNASLWCPTQTIACQFTGTNIVVIDEKIRTEYIPFILFHELGHYKGMNEQESNDYAETTLKELNNNNWKTINEL
jgi:hypothetical protein